MQNAKDKIQMALLSAMEKKPLHLIKVKTLTDAMGISRSTFYLYYDSVYATLQDIEDVFFDELQQLSTTFWYYPLDDRYFKEPHPSILCALQYIRSHQYHSMVLWGSNGDPLFQNRCKQMIRKAFFPDDVKRKFRGEHPELIISSLVSGHLELVNQWLKNYSDISSEDMAIITYQLLFGQYGRISAKDR